MVLVPDDDLATVYALVTRRLLAGKVVPVLGAGANLADRPTGAQFRRGVYLPSGRELAQELASYAGFTAPEGFDLARVSQYVAVTEGEASLYDELHTLFDADYPPTTMHHFLASVSQLNRQAGRECMLFVTTNYDALLEAALDAIDEPYDLITYIAEGRDRGLFRHQPFDGPPTVIRVPNEYTGIRLDLRPVIAKIHGAVDRKGGQDSFVITEDHYIDYITHADVAGLFPVTLAAKMMGSHFLFLGYSLRDWNFRVMLYRLWGEQEGKTYKSWAVDAHPDPVDRAAWDRRGVDILPVPVDEFVRAVQERIAAGTGSS